MANVLDTLLYGYRTVLVADVELPAHAKLNFANGFVVTDDPVTGSTDVSVSISGSTLSIPGQTHGDVLYYNGSVWTRLAAGATGRALITQGAGFAPVWSYPAGLTIAAQAAGDLLYFDGTSWIRRAIGTTGNVLSVVGGAPTWAALNLAGGAAYVTGVLPAANQAAQTLGGSLAGTTAAATVVQIDGSGGVAVVACDEVRWGSGSHGTRSIKATATTTTNAANQTLLTVAVPASVAYDSYVRLVATDTSANGTYRGEWTADLFTRRTGVNSGNLERQGATPSVTNPKSNGTLTGASFDVSISSNNLLVRGSPGATANVTWNLEVVFLLSPTS